MELRIADDLSAQSRSDRWPQRGGVVAVPRPLNAEVNTTVTFTLVEGFGKVSDLMGVGLGGDRHLASRLGLTLFSGYTNWVVTANSHEFAHQHDDIFQEGCDADFTVRWSSGHLSPLVPNNGQCHPKAGGLPEEVSYRRSQGYHLEKRWEFASEIRSSVEGLNQQQRNARWIYQRNNERGLMTYDEALAYLVNQWADITYFGNDAAQGDTVFRESDWPGEVSDTVGYLHTASLQGLSISRRRWFAWSLASAAASGRTWEGLRAVGRYVAHGERQTAVASPISVGATNLYWPDFALYPYQGGLYLEGVLPMRIPIVSGGLLSLKGGASVAGDRIGHVGIGLDGWSPFGNRWYAPRFQLGSALTYHAVDRFMTDPAVDLETTYIEPWQPPKGAKCNDPFVFSDSPCAPSHPLWREGTITYDWPHWEGRPNRHLGIAVDAGLSFGPPAWQVGTRLLYNRDDAMQNSINGLPQGLTLVASTQFFY